MCYAETCANEQKDPHDSRHADRLLLSAVEGRYDSSVRPGRHEFRGTEYVVVVVVVVVIVGPHSHSPPGYRASQDPGLSMYSARHGGTSSTGNQHEAHTSASSWNCTSVANVPKDIIYHLTKCLKEASTSSSSSRTRTRARSHNAWDRREPGRLPLRLAGVTF